MPAYIFVSADGITKPLDNLQVLGIVEGESYEEAFKQLLKDNPSLQNYIGDRDMHYNDIRAFELESLYFHVVDWEVFLSPLYKEND